MFPEAFGFGVPADHELLLQVELDLDPRSRSFASLVPGAAAFADQPLKSECPDFFQISKHLIDLTSPFNHPGGQKARQLPAPLGRRMHQSFEEANRPKATGPNP